MALWYTDPITFGSTSEADLDGTTQDIYIKPVDASGTYTTVYLDKSNFKIGGATETNGSGVATSGTNIWENGNMDIGVTKVEFSNTLEGDANNHVRARVAFGTASSLVDKTFYIDIDERSDNPIVTALPKNVCFFLEIPYDQEYIHEFYTPASSESSGWTVQTTISGGDITKELVNATTYQSDGYYRYKFSGQIQDYTPESMYDITHALVRRASSGAAIDPLPGAGAPNFGIQNWFFFDAFSNNYGFGFDLLFDAVDTSVAFYNNNTGTSQNFAVGFKVAVNPGMDVLPPGGYNPEVASLCALGSTMGLTVSHYNPPTNPNDPDNDDDDPSLKVLKVPNEIGIKPGYDNITVKGDQGARYMLHMYQCIGLKSIGPASGKSHYSFTGKGGFTDSPSRKVYTIGSTGKINHSFIVPASTTDKRYEIYLEPASGTKVKGNIPTQPGRSRHVHKAPKTITLQAAVESANDWVITGSTFSFGRKAALGSYKHISATGEVSATISSKARLVVKEINSNIRPGMYVIAPFTGGSSAGIPHKTTVTSVKGTVITLSASSSIAANTTLRFESKSSRIIPYYFEVLAGTGGDSDYQDMAINTTYRSQEAIAGLAERLNCTLSAGTSSTKSIVCDNAASEVGKIQVGMLIESTAMTVHSGSARVEVITVVPSTKTITVDEDVTIPIGTVIVVAKDASLAAPVTVSGVTNIHTQADMIRDGIATHGGTSAGSNQESAAISGYLEVASNVSNSATLTVRVDNLLKSTETSAP